MIYSRQITKVDDIFKITFFLWCGGYKPLIPADLLFPPHCPRGLSCPISHLPCPHCHTKEAPSPPPQPISGALSLLTNKNQTLLFPADDVAPKVGCQLPLKQREHQGTLQEPGTVPAAPILPGNLYKELFEIYIYIYTER